MPTALVGQVLELRVTAKVVEVLHRGARVTSHMRCAHKGGYSIQVEHLSVAHRKHLKCTPDCRTWIRLAEGFLAEVKFEFFITGCCQKTIKFPSSAKIAIYLLDRMLS